MLKCRPFLQLYLAAICALLPATTPARDSAEHVVVLVWDGMRPDFVTPTHAPTLANLASNGVFFANHHPVYVSSTIVNGTAIATGAYPQHSGIIANSEYRPEIEFCEPVGTEAIESVRRGDALTGGHYIRVPTLSEILHKQGARTAIAGAKPLALIHDRAPRSKQEHTEECPVLYAGRTMPSSVLTNIVREVGHSFPTSSIPNVGRDQWTTKALTETIWKEGVPKFSLLWLSEPDASQHKSGPGSSNALAAIASSDRNLAAVLKALKGKGVLDKTDVFVVSDHAFSTINRGVDVAKALKDAGFSAGRKLQDPSPGEIMVVGLGGSVLLYVIGHEESVVQKLVSFFQQSDFAGPIFSRNSIPGTFPLKRVLVDSGEQAPDLVVSLRWSAQTNGYGVPGLLVGDDGKVGAGTHASLSRYDMHNTLVAAGPHIRRAMVDQLPTGNADLAPTILWLFGTKPPKSMDGRILKEALVDGGSPAATPRSQQITARATHAGGQWEQYLKYTEMDGRIYLDEGNAQFSKP